MVTKTVTLPFVHVQNGPKYVYTAEVLETFLKREGSERIVSFGTYVLADPTYECSYDYLAWMQGIGYLDTIRDEVGQRCAVITVEQGSQYGDSFLAMFNSGVKFGFALGGTGACTPEGEYQFTEITGVSLYVQPIHYAANESCK